MKTYYCQNNSFLSRKIFSPSYPAYFEGQHLTIGMVKYSLLPLKEGGMTGRQCLLSRLPQEIRVISVSPGESVGPRNTYLAGIYIMLRGAGRFGAEPCGMHGRTS